jgi:hypothetical protein
MKKISAALAVLALVAAEPAFAGCGSHGGGGYSGYSSYRVRTVRSPVVVRKVVKVVKREAPQSKVRTAIAANTSTTATATEDKPEATARVVSSASALGSGVVENAPAKTVQTTPQIECKEYSAAVGEMITVPCS